MDTKIQYVCTGGCGGAVTQEEYNAGTTTCGTRGCPHFGHQFEKQLVCARCGAALKEGEIHEHPAR